METLVKNILINQQSEEVKKILAQHSWSKRYEKILPGLIYNDIMQGHNRQLDTAIDEFEEYNDLAPMKFISDSVDRYLASIGLQLGKQEK